jgi:hypothetical protein
LTVLRICGIGITWLGKAEPKTSLPVSSNGRWLSTGAEKIMLWKRIDYKLCVRMRTADSLTPAALLNQLLQATSQ